VNESAGQKLWKRRAQTALGNRRSDFHFSHSFNNNKLDDRNHFLQNAKTSVASLRRLITPTRNADHDQPGTLIIFIGIRTTPCNLLSPSFSAICFAIAAIFRILRYSLVTAGLNQSEQNHLRGAILQCLSRRQWNRQRRGPEANWRGK